MDTESSVELVGFGATSNVDDGGDSSSAGGNGIVGCLAFVVENVADSVKNNLTVQSRGLNEFNSIFGFEAELGRLASFKSRTLS